MEMSMTASELPDLDEIASDFRGLMEQKRFQDVLDAAPGHLSHDPSHRDLLYMLAVAQRMLQRIPEALETLATLEAWHPGYPRLYQERGHCYVFQRAAPEAIAAFEHASLLNPALPASWNALQALYRMSGRPEDAELAVQHAKKLESLPVEIVNTRSLLADGNVNEAEDIIRPFLKHHKEHIEGMRLLAKIAYEREYPNDSEILLESVLELAPDYHSARYDYALTLIDLHKHARAREEIEKLITIDPVNPANHITLASILVALGELDDAVALYREIIEKRPKNAVVSQSLGHALKTLGEHNEAVTAYRRATEIRPNFGEAYWSLANLKTYRFTDEELDRMREQEAEATAQADDRYHLCFALGKSLEDRNEFAESFSYYERGNALKKLECRYRAGLQEESARRLRKICTKEFFTERTDRGCDNRSPIFVLGLPRAGSTLLEQILASHSEVEGTMELANIPRLVGSLSALQRHGKTPYPDLLTDLSAEECVQFGENYLRDTLDYRSGKPYFIDKMPNNFRNIGIIQLILPNAKIIDARRDPMDCGFSNFKQLYANGHHFSYNLEDIGRYYRNYIEMMEHWDDVLPGRILRVQHEDVLTDLQGSVRRILEYCDLPFEQSCVEFHKTDRRVHTASSEQVRRPINRDGVDRWKAYEEWLGPLKLSLSDPQESGGR
jgi:tetratricopeptide (TPR) repeat protein